MPEAACERPSASEGAATSGLRGRGTLQIVVTGASRGVGAALVGHLRAAGHTVVAACRNIDDAPADGPAVALDSTDSAQLASLADRVAEHVGTVDVLVNNAGIKQAGGHPWPASAGPLDALDARAVADILATNVVGTLMTTKALLPVLDRGSVVANISSQLGSLRRGVGVDYAYNASKAALNMITVTMQRDLADRGIAAVTINPGWMRTAMGGADAPLDVSDATADLAQLVARLDSSFGGRFVDRHGDEFEW